MAETLTIDKNNKLPHAQDFNFLRKEGIRYIQDLSGKIWTDYNTHDPGITLLEAMCYAITDLGYRTSFNIVDIIAPEKLSADTWKKTFYTARQILPCNPLTISDYRKLIIDTEGVRNAWVEKSDDYEILMYLQKTKGQESSARPYSLTYEPKKDDEALRLRGLYKVFVEYENNILAEKKEDDVAKVIREKLLFHRNLCEDFIGISSVEYENVPIEAIVQVSEGTDVEMICARIYKVIQDFFSPPISFYSLEQMIEKKYSIEEIFEGPVLKYGFIDTLELESSERYRDVHISDIVSLVLGIEGVIAIKKFALPVASESPFSNFTEWINNVKERQKIPRLDIENSAITFMRSGDRHRVNSKKQPDKERVNAIFRFLESENFRTRLKGSGKDLAIPSGEFMNIADYYPFQNNLPVAYGMMEQFVDDTGVDKSSIENAINEVLDYKVGNIIRIMLNELYAEKVHKDSVQRTIVALLDESSEELPQEVIDHLLDDKTIGIHAKNILNKLMGEPDHDMPVKRQINSLIKSRDLSGNISEKARVLNMLAQSIFKKPLPQIDSKDEISRFNDTYRRFQIGLLSKRKKQTLQLRGFLMVFEQILSDYLSQLSHVRELFSFDKDLQQTYFPQCLKDVHDMEALFIDFKKYEESQIKIIETEDGFARRRNAVLDHLMARFSESMEKYSFFMKSYSGKKGEKQLIDNKIDFISDYVQVSSYRGKSFDYGNFQKSWETDNVEGIKKRICRLLGIKDYTRRSIASDAIYIEEIRLDNDVTRYVVILRDPDNKDNILLRGDQDDYAAESEANEILDYILENGVNNNLYEIEGRKDKWSYKLKRATQENDYEVVAESMHFHDRNEMEINFKRTIEVLTGFSNDENFHVVEHILLRPKIGPRKGLAKRPGSPVDTDTVTLLDTADIPDEIKPLDEEVSEEISFEFKIMQVKDQSGKDKTMWKISLLKDNNEMLIVNEEFSIYKHLTRRMEHIKEYGSDDANYVRGQNADGRFIFKIMAGDRYLAEGKRNYRKQEDMDEEITQLIDFFSYELGPVSDEPDDDSLTYYADPYSFQVSLFIPSWPKRFRSPTFRHLLEKTIYMETPSHIYPHVYWLSHKEMKEFEEAYKVWIEEMADPETEIPSTDIVNNMIFVLKKLWK